MKKVNAVDPSFSYHIRGGIVPHHTFASEILSDFFHRLSKQKPKTVILIGPNHYEKGDGKVLISQAQWQTVFGIVEPNSWYIDQLVDSGFIKVDEKVVPEDHAVAALMPYLEHYLPETTVVPLLVSGFMNESEVAQLADELAPLVDEDTVIIAAVDFSHYLMSAQAHQRDELTSKLMRDHEYSEILRLNNEYLDSPQAIVALLMVMKKLEADQTELLAHTNSGDMQNNATIQTTSYFSMGFY